MDPKLYIRWETRGPEKRATRSGTFYLDAAKEALNRYRDMEIVELRHTWEDEDESA